MCLPDCGGREEMKVLKYISSIIFLAAVTFAALYLPGVYFQNYRYDMVIEDVEQHYYDELTSSKAEAWQVHQMIESNNYTVTEVYTRHSANEEQNKKMDGTYMEMIEGVFRKYLDDTKVHESEAEAEHSGDITLKEYMEEWMKEEDIWQVEQVEILNLTDIFYSRIVNVQLYRMSLNIPDQNIFMNIWFHPDSNIFYRLALQDKRYLLENIDEDSVRWELYRYYSKEDGYSISQEEEDWLSKLMEVITAPELLIVGINSN